MAEFHSIFCRPFVLSVLLILGVGGIGDRAGWCKTGWGGWCGVGGVGLGGVRDGKKPCLGHPMRSHDAHTVANDIPWAM